MSGHTAGPWVTTEEGGTVYIDTDAGHPVCMMMSGSAHDQDRMDATLIAAAPELLEALVSLVADIDENKGRRCSLDVARAAIAKAKGEN